MALQGDFGTPGAGQTIAGKYAQPSKNGDLVKFDALSDGSGNFSCAMPVIHGGIVRIEILPDGGGTQPTNGFSMTLSTVINGKTFTWSKTGNSNAAQSQWVDGNGEGLIAFAQGVVTVSFAGLGAGKGVSAAIFIL